MRWGGEGVQGGDVAGRGAGMLRGQGGAHVRRILSVLCSLLLNLSSDNTGARTYIPEGD